MTPKELGEHIDTGFARRIIHSLHIALMLIVLSAMISTILISSAFATPIDSRSLNMSSSTASALTSHSFYLTLNSAVLVGSISIEYCQESPLFGTSCTAPTGLNLGSVVISSQSGETGFSIHGSSSSSKIILSRTPSIVVPGASIYNFSNVVNPSLGNTSAFVRVATYASNDATGLRIDEGGLAFAITNPLNISADIAPFLILCTGVTVSIDCSSSDGTTINLGALSPASTKAATSQFAIASNDDTGYNAYILGSTMTSGINEIPRSNSQSASDPGSGQFGLNLVSNSSPSVGSTPSGAGSGQVASSYDDSNLFKFTSGDLIARSTESTNFNRFTLSYIVNIPRNQSPGLYSTTMTVLGVADF